MGPCRYNGMRCEKPASCRKTESGCAVHDGAAHKAPTIAVQAAKTPYILISSSSLTQQEILAFIALATITDWLATQKTGKGGATLDGTKDHGRGGQTVHRRVGRRDPEGGGDDRLRLAEIVGLDVGGAEGVVPRARENSRASRGWERTASSSAFCSDRVRVWGPR